MKRHFHPAKILFFFIFVFCLSAICAAQPSNDDCSGAITLTSGTSCNNATYNLKKSTASSGVPAGCTAGTHWDVWFKFTAVSASHTAAMSNMQSAFTNPEIQIFSGSCGSLSSIGCAAATTLTVSGLTIGNTYYVRISNAGGSQPNGNQYTFDFCITHPNPPPVNDDCSGATTLVSGFTCSTTAANMRYATSNGPAGACGGATATTTYDLWFRFQAVATSHTVTLSGLGAKFSAVTTYMQMLSGACGSLASLGCQNASTRMTVNGLTIGVFYYIRVYVTSNPLSGPTSDWNFSICVQHPPVNDDCTGAIVLTPGGTCTNTAGTLDLARPSAAPLGCFAIGTYYDVWYSFVATATTHTVSLSGLGSSFTAPRIQIYGGNCAALASIGCSVPPVTALTQPGLTIGTTYYVRIANFNVPPWGIGSVANFNICITAAAAPPGNDNCAGAILLTSNTVCNNVSGTLFASTSSSAGLPACGNNGSPDVWYRFVAQTAYPTITLSSIGANFSSSGPRLQLLSGTCGSFTALACTTTPLAVATAVGGAGLTPGTTYYIRVTTNSSTPASSGAWGFNICITDPVGAVVDYAKSYVNTTDSTIGGTINPGDILEIRATLVVDRNAGIHKAIDSIGFYDTIFGNNNLIYQPVTIALKTNEGKMFQPASPATGFSDAADADQGWYASLGTDTAIRINIGIGASGSARGRLMSRSIPSFYGNTCIILATYRVKVAGAPGTKIKYGGGSFRYRDSTTGKFFTVNFPSDSLMVSLYNNSSLCPNSVSPTNILGDEYNGSFGTVSGSPAFAQNRGTSPNTNYQYAVFGASSPQDYFYGIANNTSATASTNQSLPRGNAARVHTVWDITGDHTGATNTAKGNPPCDISQPQSPANPCGYMLVVNAAYRTDLAFNFNVTGVCPNTYYEISGWFKNICSKCGCDVNGKGNGGGAGYIPTALGDSSGVRPNIAFQVNGVDYYTTGDLLYNGIFSQPLLTDTTNTWVKKGFVYKTGINETSFTLSLRNNAPGGGGNDWALDDLKLSTCLPNMSYSPSLNANVCENNTLTLYDTIRSYFDTYVEYKWQRSTDGGASWSDIPGAAGTGTPVQVGSNWEYIVTYTIPPSWTTYAHNGDLYRVVVASTPSNLNSESCNFSDPTAIQLIVLTTCVPPLADDLLAISGRLITDKARINWTAAREESPVEYIIQRSDDGVRFSAAGTVSSHINPQGEKSYYSFDDPVPVTGKTYYRIAVMAGPVIKKYSRTILLAPGNNNIWALGQVVNPFYQELQYEISTPQAAIAKIELVDNFGKILKTEHKQLGQGVNALSMNNTGQYAGGIYLLKVTLNGTTQTKKVLKGTR